MRKIHRVLRLFFEAGLSIRAIARSIQASPSTVGDYIRRAEVAGLSWPLPDKLDECALEARLFPGAAVPTRVERAIPDWAQVHAERRGKNVTLALLWQEYKAEYPEGLAIQPVLRTLPRLGACCLSLCNARHRHLIVPRRTRRPSRPPGDDARTNTPMSWMARLKRVFNLDISVCPKVRWQSEGDCHCDRAQCHRSDPRALASARPRSRRTTRATPAPARLTCVPGPKTLADLGDDARVLNRSVRLTLAPCRPRAHPL